MRGVLAVGFVLALSLTGTSAASWSTPRSGTAAAKATSMSVGNTPTATAPTLSTNVTVSWVRSSYASGATVAGYVVHRYDAITGTSAAVGASCGGVVVGSSCTENGVIPGSWVYSVTPAQGTWRGAEGARSAAVTVPGL